MKNRLPRVREVLKRELSAAIAREVQFPVPIVTVCSVDITPDLKQAHVFVSAIGGPAERAEVLRRLEETRVALQAGVARRVAIKNTPHLHFHLDESIERGSRVLAIMCELGMDISPQAAPVPPVTAGQEEPEAP